MASFGVRLFEMLVSKHVYRTLEFCKGWAARWTDQQHLPFNALTTLRFAVGLPLVKVPSGFLLDRCIVLAFVKCPDLPVHRGPRKSR